MNSEDWARRAAELAAGQVAARAHVVVGAGGARPGQADGMGLRPAGVTLLPASTDPADPAVFAAGCGDQVCGGRFDHAHGGIAGGRVAHRTDIDLLVYLAELASLPEDAWQLFFETFSPRRLLAPDRIVWGEDCRERRHFDGEGLVNWCMEQAIEGRYAIRFDVATWATDESGTVDVALTEEPRPGDLVVRTRPGGNAEIGILVDTDDPARTGGPADVVLAEDTSVGVVRRRFSPDEWTLRRRATIDLLHD